MQPDTETQTSFELEEDMDCEFVKECFTTLGGFAKYNFMKDKPDILHTFYGVSAMSLGQKQPGIKEIEPTLAIPKWTYDAFLKAN